jgi:hypothetical protein
MAKFSKFWVNYPDNATPTHTFYFTAPFGSYTGIEVDAGIEAVDPTDVDVDMPTCKVEELVGSGVVERRHLRLNVTGTRDKYAKVLVAKHKSATFNAAVVGDAFRGGTIEGVVTRQRASYS